MNRLLHFFSAVVVRLVFLWALAALVGCSSVALRARQTLRTAEVTASAAEAVFAALYKTKASECLATAAALPAGQGRLDHYNRCMKEWDTRLDKIAAARDTLGAAQLAALRAVELYEACAVDNLCKQAASVNEAAIWALVTKALTLALDVKALVLDLSK